MERLSKGAEYFFVSLRSLKVVGTHDEHFESDDERFRVGNYYPAQQIAKAALEEIQEKYLEELQELDERDARVRRQLIKEVSIIVGRAEPKRGKEKEEDAVLVQDLVLTYGAYRDEVKAIKERRDEIKTSCLEIIKTYSNKQ